MKRKILSIAMALFMSMSLVACQKEEVNSDEGQSGSEELQKISGIGEVKAKGIIQYREKNGGFNSIEEIKNIDGIGEKTFEKMKDQIKV